jgi:hypothetical protein
MVKLSPADKGMARKGKSAKEVIQALPISALTSMTARAAVRAIHASST